VLTDTRFWLGVGAGLGALWLYHRYTDQQGKARKAQG